VSPEAAQQLVADGAFVLDVRTPRQYREEGHIPGAQLLPSELVASAPAVVPEDGRSILVVCDRGARSRQAAVLLVQAGFQGVGYVVGGMAAWPGPRTHGARPRLGPSPWLLTNALVAPRGARTLDVACGRGRHALLLAAAGSPVRALDRDASRVDALGLVSRRLRLPLDALVVDLETASIDLGEGEWELVLVFEYLHRPLFPALVRALRPGGVLLCEAEARLSAARHPCATSSARLLEPGELATLVAPLEVVRSWEGELDGRQLASIAARKPRSPALTVPTSHRALVSRVAAAPATHSRPAASANGGGSAPGSRVPGARNR
jgi:rhodanese-related sulfurtransferase/SAM-dependent methyltransferase